MSSGYLFMANYRKSSPIHLMMGTTRIQLDTLKSESTEMKVIVKLPKLNPFGPRSGIEMQNHFKQIVECCVALRNIQRQLSQLEMNIKLDLK